MADPLIRWHLDRETRFPFGRTSPDASRWAPIGFPPPWPDRPWIYANMVASANGVVAWRRRDRGDDPVRGVLGDRTRPERVADLRLMRFLRCFGDVAVGAETIRQQPELVQTPMQPGDPPMPELYAFRVAHGLPRNPRHVVYSVCGRLPMEHRIFTTPDIEPIVVTTEDGVDELKRRGARLESLRLVVEPLLDPAGLRRAHERLFADCGVRYLDCEGGMTVLAALHAAGLLDEVFFTRTDVVVDARQHEGLLTIFDFEAEGATLLAEGRIASDSGYLFQRWRFNER